MGEDGEEGKKKEKEVIGVSCHFSSGGGDLIRIRMYMYSELGNLVPSDFFLNSCWCIPMCHVSMWFFFILDEFYTFGLFIYLLS